MGLPGGGRRRNRAHSCARSSPTSPGSAEALFGDADGICVLLCCFSAAWGGLGLYLFIPSTALVLGGLKGQETRGWFLTTRCIYPLPWAYSSENSQGVPLDSLGVSAVEIGRINAPDPSPMLPASAEVHSGGGGSVFAFLDCISMAWGPGGLPLFVPCAAMLVWGLKEQDIRGWFLTTHVFWVFMCLWRE